MQTGIVIKPLITEQTMTDVNKGKYTFIVAKEATKESIKSAIKQMFNVTVIGVSTNVVKGKRTRIGARRIEVRQPAYKKATVTLKKGDKISLLDPGAGEEEKKK